MNPANANLKYDRNGLDLTESSEGKSLTPYPDQGLFSVCYGHRGTDVVLGNTYTDAQCEQLLEHDIEAAESFVKRVVNEPLNQGEFDGCVDFCFNLGVGTFLHSSLLTLINQGNFNQAALVFQKYDLVAGKVNNGILRRRLREDELFEHGILEAS